MWAQAAGDVSGVMTANLIACLSGLGAATLLVAVVRGLCRPPWQPSASPQLSPEASLAETLVLLKVSGNVMEQIMEALQAADPATRKAVCQAVEAICEHEPDEGQVLATVRGLCQLHPTSAPPAPKPEPQHAFTTL